MNKYSLKKLLAYISNKNININVFSTVVAFKKKRKRKSREEEGFLALYVLSNRHFHLTPTE